MVPVRRAFRNCSGTSQRRCSLHSASCSSLVLQQSTPLQECAEVLLARRHRRGHGNAAACAQRALAHGGVRGRRHLAADHADGPIQLRRSGRPPQAPRPGLAAWRLCTHARSSQTLHLSKPQYLDHPNSFWFLPFVLCSSFHLDMNPSDNVIGHLQSSSGPVKTPSRRHSFC